MPGTIITVTTPAASAALTTLAAAKLRCAVATSTDDAAISALIDQASGLVADFCGRAFGVEAINETFRFTWRAGDTPLSQSGPRTTSGRVEGPPLILSRSPVVSVVDVTEAGTLLAAGTDYETDANAGLLYRIAGDTRSWWAMPKVSVDYTAGYVLPADVGTRTLPVAVEAVTLALVASAYLSLGRDPATYYELVEGVGRNQYFDRGVSPMKIDENMQMLLAPYVARAF